MNSLVYHIVSGHAFFSGIALLILAIIAANSTHAFFRRVSLLSFLLGVIAIVISSTAIPYWLYAAGAVVTLSWSVLRSKQTWRRPTMYATIAIWLLAAAMEVPYHVTPTIAAEFETDLDALLSYLVRKDRQLVMFELPLPPFYHEFGRIQRTLATKHNVILLPKRIFLSVIAGGDATLDTIHLSQPGHQRMADTVWQIVSTAYGASQHDHSDDSSGTVEEE